MWNGRNGKTMKWLKSSIEDPVWLICPHCGEPVHADKHKAGEMCEKCGSVNDEDD